MITITRQLTEYSDESEVPTPYVRVDVAKLEGNLRRLQDACTANGVKLIPHIKTHKMVQVAKRQLEFGAAGLTFAKISEAEALLPAAPQLIFIAHSLVSPLMADRLKALSKKTDELVLAITSKPQGEALSEVVKKAGLRVSIAVGADTGLHREGARSFEEIAETVKWIQSRDEFELKVLYGHEGFCYGKGPGEIAEAAEGVVAQMTDWRDRLGLDLELWPGCSVTSGVMAEQGKVEAVRPGAYVFGDMSLVDRCQVLEEDQAALTVVATVVDKPEPDLALIDAGSKVFSGDKSRDGHSARLLKAPRLPVSKVNEEHGYIKGEEVAEFEVGQRISFLVTHVCPVLNLTDRVVAVRDGQLEIWPVEARGCVE